MPSPSVGVVYANVARRLGIGAFDPELVEQNFRATFRKRLLVGYTVEEWREVVSQTLKPISASADDPILFEALWNEFLKPEVWSVFEEVIPVLECLQSSGVRMAVTSNWDCRLGATLRNLGLEHYFESILPSADVGRPKPDGSVFRETANRLRLPPEEILHVGDSALEDFEGAKAAGYQAVLLDRSGADRVDAQRDLRFLKQEFTVLP